MARLTLRLDFGPDQAIGHGKVRLLEAVRDHGSISAAGRAMGMSYRRARVLIDELNREISESTQPRKKPATIPSVTPTTIEMPVATNATSSETRAP